MLNFAPVKYANCFESEGGPIFSIEESKVDINGVKLYVANARLADVNRPAQHKHIIFSPVDGTGIDGSQIGARHKAISEAIERWAHYQSTHTSEKKDYGFNVDPTSNGMAAFPGLFARQARKYAFREAVERFSLIAWWHGLSKLKENCDNVDGIRMFLLDQPFKDHKMVITQRATDKGYTAFGYGCAKNLLEAREGAISEMERSRILLESFFKRNPGFEIGDLSTIPDYMERRLVYFSMPEGVAEFEDKLAHSNGSICPEKPKPVFDGEIKGPWSKYATVWRIAFEMPTQAYLDPNQLFFYW